MIESIKDILNFCNCAVLFDYKNNYIIILICILVIILYYYMNTIGDMQIEMDFYGHYNEFEYIQDYVKFS